MNYRALALGIVLGFLFAAAPSCQSGNCNSSNCRGCCLGGVCLDPGRQSACGSGGITCVACAEGQGCVNNQCASGGVGAPCNTNAECGGVGDPSATCKLTTTLGSPYPGGYCTKPCTGQLTDCPSGSVCAGGLSTRQAGEYDVLCWKICRFGFDADCRQGYGCWGLGSVGGCWLFPVPLPDAGPPAPPGLMGSPCTTDVQCKNPPNDGFCNAERMLDGGSTAYAGGYCSAPCDVGGHSHCGDGGVCVTFITSLGFASFCGGQCPNPGGGPVDGGCRPGYVCQPLVQPDGGQSPFGMCNNCNNPGRGCPGGTCTADGFCQ